MADVQPQGVQSEQSDHKHEQRDVNPRSVLGAAGCLVAAAILIHLALWGMLTLFDARPKRADVALSPLARLPQDPPPPRLQAYPPLDLNSFRAGEDAELNKYRWRDRSAGTVQIPVEKAKELFLKEESARADSAAVRQPAKSASTTGSGGGTGQ